MSPRDLSGSPIRPVSKITNSLSAYFLISAGLIIDFLSTICNLLRRVAVSMIWSISSPVKATRRPSLMAASIVC